MNTEKITLKCPNCGKKFQIPIIEYNKKYKKVGYAAMFCSYRCGLRFSERR